MTKTNPRHKALLKTRELATKLRKADTMTRHKKYGPAFSALLEELGIQTATDPKEFDRIKTESSSIEEPAEKEPADPHKEAASKLSPDAIKAVIASLKG